MKIKSVKNYVVFNKILFLFFVSYNNFLNAFPLLNLNIPDNNSLKKNNIKNEYIHIYVFRYSFQIFHQKYNRKKNDFLFKQKKKTVKILFTLF